MKKTNNNIDRREFLKRMGAGSLLTAAAFTGCKTNNLKLDPSVVHGEIPTDKMTYRTNERVGDKVSILGYGCMRFPQTLGKINVPETEKQLLHAIENGVNYFKCADDELLIKMSMTLYRNNQTLFSRGQQYS